MNSKQKEKKICQWVENATLSRGCSGIVRQNGTIYCDYHCMTWEDRKSMKREDDMDKERKPA